MNEYSWQVKRQKDIDLETPIPLLKSQIKNPFRLVSSEH